MQMKYILNEYVENAISEVFVIILKTYRPRMTRIKQLAPRIL